MSFVWGWLGVGSGGCWCDGCCLASLYPYTSYSCLPSINESITYNQKPRHTPSVLYDLLTHPAMDEDGPPVLVACNKSDAAGAKGALGFEDH